MDNSFLKDASALRDRAWDSVKQSPAYAIFKSLDEAVVAAGGESRVNAKNPEVRGLVVGSGVVRRQVVSSVPTLRVSHADIAYKVLRNAREPLPIGRFLEQVLAAGAQIGGEDPLPNFRSTLSRDARFESVMRNGMYFWWFTAEALPSGWNEPGADLLAETPGSSVNSSKETAHADNT